MFKKIMENKTSRTIFAFVAVVMAVVLILVLVFVLGDKNSRTEEPTTTEVITTTQNVVIETDIPEESTETTTENTEVLTLVEPTVEIITNKPSSNTAKPEKPVTPEITKPKNNDTIQIGDESVQKYSCGKSGHHCDSKETHEFIVSLENAGCDYCGSHSCKSFYAVDEWGNACYDVTKCPEYSSKKDPVKYCQDCGKKVSDGYNGTCLRFTVDTECPECGKKVKAKTCHSH